MDPMHSTIARHAVHLTGRVMEGLIDCLSPLYLLVELILSL